MRYIIGLFFVVIGILFIVQGFNLDLLFRLSINFSKFWPFILIMIGISILSRNLKWLKFINLLIAILFFALLFFWDYSITFEGFSKKEFNYDDYEKMDIKILPDSEIIDIVFDLPITNIDISTDENSEIISGYYYSFQKLNIVKENGKIKFKTSIPMIDKNKYKIYLKLPVKNIYNIYINGSIANVTLSESLNVIRNCRVNTGVSRITGKIEEFKEGIFLDVDSGVSKITFTLPENSTYYLNYDSGVKKVYVDNRLINDSEGKFYGNIDAGVLTINLNTW